MKELIKCIKSEELIKLIDLIEKRVNAIFEPQEVQETEVTGILRDADPGVDSWINIKFIYNQKWIANFE